MIKEWNILRAIACLCIVFLHSSTQTSRILGHPQMDIYHFGRILLCFATPTFIVLSIIILANRYTDRLPNNFWATRIKFIYVPFIVFGVIDALVGKYLNPRITLDLKILDNVLTGKFVGWFILVIFQFYILHYLVTRFKISMKWLFPLSVIVMGIYLYCINNGIITTDGYDYVLKLPFIAWFGYFTMGFITGKHYAIIAEKLLKYRWFTLFIAAIAIGIVYLSYRNGIRAVDSRRLDLFPLVIAFSSVILAWGQLITRFKLLNLISNYSFGIYLLHWQYQRLISPYIAEYITSYIPCLLTIFFVSLLASMLTIKILSYIPFGSFIVGKVRKKKPSVKTT